MTTKVTFESTELEVPCVRHRKPTYRIVSALFVIVNGVKIYPPMRINDAKKYAKNLEKQDKEN